MHDMVIRAFSFKPLFFIKVFIALVAGLYNRSIYDIIVTTLLKQSGNFTRVPRSPNNNPIISSDKWYSFVRCSSFISLTVASGSISLTNLFILFMLTSLSVSYDIVDVLKFTTTLFRYSHLFNPSSTFLAQLAQSKLFMLYLYFFLLYLHF